MINRIVIVLLVYLRPALGPATCLYPISCTEYAIECLKQQSTLKAVWLIIFRLVSCNPLTPIYKLVKKRFLRSLKQ